MPPGSFNSGIEKKCYSIYLGNGHLIHLGSLRTANNYMSEINRFINYQIIDLNENYISVYSDYRRAWLYLDPTWTAEYKTIKSLTAKCISIIDTKFESVFTYTGSNAIHNIWSTLNLICDNLTTTCNLLINLFLKRSSYYEIKKIELNRNRSTLIKETLKNYKGPGADSNKAFVKSKKEINLRYS